MRCFFALKFNEPTVEYLDRVIAELRSHGADVAWVRRENLHVTLRFLGEITQEQVDDLRRRNARDATTGAIELSARGLGAFPGLRNARVVWAGVAHATDRDREMLFALQSHTETLARSIGVAQEDRRYRPHVTLGRVRRPGDRLRELIDDVTTRDLDSPLSTIDQFHLMLSTQGNPYETLATWRI